jgi:sterigmatocystin 8-O-methyltransferase
MVITDDLRGLSIHLDAQINTYLDRVSAVGAPSPSLKEPFPGPIKDDAAQQAKVDIIRACERIMALVLGPMEWGMMQNMSFVDPACVSAMVEMGIPELIPSGPEPTSLEELVKRTGAAKDILSRSSRGKTMLGAVLLLLTEKSTERIMRVCTSRLYFEEIAPEQFIHNGCSLTLLAPPIKALVGHWYHISHGYPEVG